jgi:adenylate kinase family enzyme
MKPTLDTGAAKVRKLAAQLPDLAPELESLEDLLARQDVQSSLNKIRFIAEKVLHSLCTLNDVSWGKDEPTLERMIGPLISDRCIPKDVSLHLRTVQTYSSPGSHYQESSLSPVHVGIALDAFAEFLSWYGQGLDGGNTGAEELPDRQAYIQRYLALIQGARAELVISTSKMHPADSSADARRVNAALGDAVQRKVRVRVLLADGYDRLPAALELGRSHQVAVRLDPAVHFADLNFTCADGERVILATHRPSGQLSKTYRPSTSWVEFQNYSLASVLLREFDQRWHAPTSRTTGQYLREAVPRLLAVQSEAMAVRELRLEPDEIQKYRSPQPLILFLVGRPGSGKTTLAALLHEHLCDAAGFRRGVCLSDLEYLRQVFTSGKGEREQRVERTPDGGFFIRDPKLYEEALLDLARRVRAAKPRHDLIILEFARRAYREALGTLAANGVKADLVVYVDVSLETALERNAVRAARREGDNHYVSEQEMRETFGDDDMEGLAREEPANVLRIQNEMDWKAVGAAQVTSVVERIREILR